MGEAIRCGENVASDHLAHAPLFLPFAMSQERVMHKPLDEKDPEVFLVIKMPICPYLKNKVV